MTTRTIQRGITGTAKNTAAAPRAATPIAARATPATTATTASHPAGGRHPAAAPREDVEALSASLEKSLLAMTVEHEKLLGLARAQRAAIRGADAAALAACTTAQQEAVQRIETMETERRALAERLARAVGLEPIGGTRARPGEGARGWRVSVIASKLPAVWRERVAEAAKKLRDSAERVSNEHGVIRAAAESLSLHMEGIMQQVGRKLSDAGLYGRGGRVGTTGLVGSACTLDMVT